MLAAPRSHYKSIIALLSAGSAQKKGNLVIWIDSEFAFDVKTALMFGVDLSPEKFLLIQDNSIENVQSFIMNTFEGYKEKEDGKVFMVLDSIGTLITSKTLEDSIEGKDVSDMTVSKKKNNLAKLLLRVSGLNNITVVLINHVYAGMSMYDTGTISGGSGSQYVASSILKITSKAKDKDKDGDVGGNIMTANTEKGRMARENSKLKFRASYEDGINTYYGILEDALEGGYIDKPSVGWYSRPNISEESDKKFRESELYNKDFWTPIFKETDLKSYLETKYSYEDSMTGLEKIYDTEFEV